MHTQTWACSKPHVQKQSLFNLKNAQIMLLFIRFSWPYFVSTPKTNKKHSAQKGNVENGFKHMKNLRNMPVKLIVIRVKMKSLLWKKGEWNTHLAGGKMQKRLLQRLKRPLLCFTSKKKKTTIHKNTVGIYGLSNFSVMGTGNYLVGMLEGIRWTKP